jgi:polysaccharide biosynthesis/export protein
MKVWCALLALLIPLTGGAAPRAAGDASESENPAPASEKHRVISAGDELSFEIVEDKDKDAPFAKRVSDTGDLNVPYVGSVRVAGKTCSEAAAQIAKLLEKDYYYAATVRLTIEQFNPRTSYGSGAAQMSRVIMSGRVNVKGPIEFPKGDKLTVSAAVLKAGPDMFADLKKVKLTRTSKEGSRQTMIINVQKITRDGLTGDDIELRDGDYIDVPRQFITLQ